MMGDWRLFFLVWSSELTARKAVMALKVHISPTQPAI